MLKQTETGNKRSSSLVSTAAAAQAVSTAAQQCGGTAAENNGQHAETVKIQQQPAARGGFTKAPEGVTGDKSRKQTKVRAATGNNSPRSSCGLGQREPQCWCYPQGSSSCSAFRPAAEMQLTRATAAAGPMVQRSRARVKQQRWYQGAARRAAGWYFQQSSTGRGFSKQQQLKLGPQQAAADELTITSFLALPSPAYCSTLLVGALWQRLCPALVALLGSPVSQRLARASGRAEGQMGRGSGCLAHPGPLFNNQQARAIYNVACGLVVTMGSVGEMRPVLESLFYRMLLYPPPQCRQDALKAITELISSPVKLVQLAGPILYPDPRNPHQNDLALFRLVMDSLAECGNCSDTEVQRLLVECVSTLLTSLEKLSLGSTLSQQHVQVINTIYARLQDGDYSGPLTYENKSKLPKYEISESMKQVSDSAASDTLSQKIDDLEEDEDEETKDEREDEENKIDNKGSDKIELQGEEKGDSESEDQSKELKKQGSRKKKVCDHSGDKGADSDASGDTEGPENEEDMVEELFDLGEEAEQQQQQREAVTG
nr:uncharacterized protein LOC128693424 [Cherax quadricarinatus]